jgi:cobalt-zinc-cadmium efflux system membrane fusion protein
MKTQHIIIVGIALALAGGGLFMLLPSQPKVAPESSAQAEEAHENEAKATTIKAESAKAAGIGVETAGSAQLDERLALTGKIILNPETSAEVKARFPGIVKSVRKTVGEAVAVGETLATVESNDSLQTYAVTSPRAGVVLNRQANVGDTAAENTMFTVANLATVVAELHVFPKDLSRIQVGQQVDVQSIDGTIKGTGEITSLLPTAEADTQSVAAWVRLTNEDKQWKAGMAIQGAAVVNRKEVPLAVKTPALQTLDNQQVVFVNKGETYTAVSVTVGQSDGTWTEITTGLTSGSLYVAQNSFVVKADIEKAGAEHAD